MSTMPFLGYRDYRVAGFWLQSFLTAWFCAWGNISPAHVRGLSSLWWQCSDTLHMLDFSTGMAGFLPMEESAVQAYVWPQTIILSNGPEAIKICSWSTAFLVSWISGQKYWHQWSVSHESIVLESTNTRECLCIHMYTISILLMMIINL